MLQCMPAHAAVGVHGFCEEAGFAADACDQPVGVLVRFDAPRTPNLARQHTASPSQPSA